jgi:hypothetical protein
MERMQAEQERFNAQVERQRAEAERMAAQRERQAAQVARQRAEQERRTTVDNAGSVYSTGPVMPPTLAEAYGQSPTISFERLLTILTVAQDVCPKGQDEAYKNASRLLSDDEGALLTFYCVMYIQGEAASRKGAPSTQ